MGLRCKTIVGEIAQGMIIVYKNVATEKITFNLMTEEHKVYVKHKRVVIKVGLKDV